LARTLCGNRVTDPGASPQWTLPSGARVPETTVHAIALENLLSGKVLETAASWRLWILTALLCITVGGMVAARPPMWSGVVTLLAMAATAFFSFGLFLQDIWLDVSIAWLAMAATFLQGVVTRAALQEREATRVASTVEALERAGEIIATQANSQELLRMVLEWASSVMEAEGASALIIDDNGQFQVAATTGLGTRGLELLTDDARAGNCRTRNAKWQADFGTGRASRPAFSLRAATPGRNRVLVAWLAARPDGDFCHLRAAYVRATCC
jgi:hypothetical protein